MEAEGPWRGLKGTFRNLWRVKDRDNTGILPQKGDEPATSSRNSSILSTAEACDNLSDTQSYRSPPVFRRDVSPLISADEGDPTPPLRAKFRSRESRSLSPRGIYRVCPEEASLDLPQGKSRSDGKSTSVRFEIPESSSEARQRPRKEERVNLDDELEVEEEEEDGLSQAFKCPVQKQLSELIISRGYHIKEHVPRQVLEDKIVGNIRRREKIALLLRQTELKKELTRERTHQQPTREPRVEPFHFNQVLDLVTKVWTRRGVQGVERQRARRIDWTSSEFAQECLKEHNRLRSIHGAPALELSDHLCEEAQTWANRLAHMNTIEYSTENGRGENILSTTVREGITGAKVVKVWYDSGRNFNYKASSSADLAHVDCMEKHSQTWCWGGYRRNQDGGCGQILAKRERSRKS